MATLNDLCTKGQLSKVDSSDILDADQQPFRRLYMTQVFEEWMRKTLPSLTTDGYVAGAATPVEQVYVLMQDFIRGRQASDFERPPVRLRPGQFGIWELRTADLRIFGAFHRPDVFLACSACTKLQAMRNNNSGYTHHISTALQDINKLDLDPPKIQLGDVQDVLPFQA